MDVVEAVVTLFLVMDPLGNVPLFLAVLRAVPEHRRQRVLVREVVIAYGVLVAFLFLGGPLLRLLGLDTEAIRVAGGIVLFLIALRMIFPTAGGETALPGEPFIVPLAIPLIAGPSTLATVLLLQAAAPSTAMLVMAVTIAWAATGAILLSSTFLYRVLGDRGLVAMERLMGMLLVMIAVQMLMDGVRAFATAR